MNFEFLKSTSPKTIPLIILLSVLTYTFSGCSQPVKDAPDRAVMSGLVKLNGALLEEGTITFSPISPTTGPASGAKISNGSYSIPEESGPVIGNNRVEVKAYKKTGKKIEAGTPNPSGTMVDEIVSLIPGKYNTQSKLTVQVNAGDNANTDFDLLTQE